MTNCPKNCTVCEYESCCSSAMFMDGCVFYPPVKTFSFSQTVKNFFHKLFNK